MQAEAWSRAWLSPVAALVASLLFVVAGCAGPTCRSACEKSFTTCALTGLSSSSTIDAQIEACTQACYDDIRSYPTEARAVGWVACVDAFQCDPSDDGVELCTTCQSGYYLGQSTGTACQSESP